MPVKKRQQRCVSLNDRRTYVDAEIVEKLQRHQICTSQTARVTGVQYYLDINIHRQTRWSQMENTSMRDHTRRPTPTYVRCRCDQCF